MDRNNINTLFTLHQEHMHWKRQASTDLSQGEVAEESRGSVRLAKGEGRGGAGGLQTSPAVLGSDLSLEGPPVLWVCVESLQKHEVWDHIAETDAARSDSVICNTNSALTEADPSLWPLRALHSTFPEADTAEMTSRTINSVCVHKYRTNNMDSVAVHLFANHLVLLSFETAD